ncbi:MAG: non-canonical purine NTP pyrophosphatase, RdgB/HAM1 family [Deltaproteobacteria bacterium RBG_13_49_15]|nr:MAG: non-canonical purine NTP pyrophosphatase, RdgB/HAM1 family [Deltaproteobacteria bacterium RBG_13_49_15]
MENLVTIVIATTNKGKTSEIRALLEGFPIIIKNLGDYGPIPPAEENGIDFEENAFKKAHHTAKILGLPALSDDSGLMVEALGGLPGVHSARYAGLNASDEKRCKKLLESMKGMVNRKAVFGCVLSLAVPVGAALTYEGRCEGLITEEPKGKNGFGFDPVFFYPPLQKTFAELSRVEKSRVSHRGKAFTELKNEFDKVLVWICQNMLIQEKFNCQGGIGAC